MKTTLSAVLPRKTQAIPTQLTEEQFRKFVLPHLSVGRRGPKTKIPLYKVFNYILHLMHTGMQWMSLPIERDATGKPEIHYTRVFKHFQKWVNDNSLANVFENSLVALQAANLLDVSVLHGDGSSTVAKKGGDGIGYNGHKHFKGEKVIAIVDRNVNVIAPYVQAAGNRNESLLLAPAIKGLKKQRTR